jgi:hypothetical protein
VSTFTDRGYRVVSATDPHGLILGPLDRLTPPKKIKEKTYSVITKEDKQISYVQN